MVWSTYIQIFVTKISQMSVFSETFWGKCYLSVPGQCGGYLWFIEFGGGVVEMDRDYDGTHYIGQIPGSIGR